MRVATAEHPDLLLLDINLPDRTGWEVLRELKRRGRKVPTIVLSAVRVSQSRMDEFRPLAFLPKLFPIDALLRLVLGELPMTGKPLRRVLTAARYVTTRAWLPCGRARW